MAVSPKLPRITALDPLPRFVRNFAAHATNSLSDNADVYRAIEIE